MIVEKVCERVGVDPVDPKPGSYVGIALQTLGEMPIHGLRHPVNENTNGWYLWCGEYSEEDDFFQPLHVEHLTERFPLVLKYLSLPPGYRFMINDSGYEDIWYDDSLLQG